MTVEILTGDARSLIKGLSPGSIDCVVTSPPYFGQRDYGVGGQIGLEQSPHEFVSVMVDLFRDIRVALKDSGTVWLNIGDSYAAQRGGTAMPAETIAGGKGGKGDDRAHRGRQTISPVTEAARDGSPARKHSVAHRNAGRFGLKHKDLIGVPWRLALALQDDGWWLRRDNIWHKPNPTPESVTDRCTTAHEYVFHLSKSDRYYYDSAAIAEPATGREPGNKGPTKGGLIHEETGDQRHRTAANLHKVKASTTRNRRSVWTVATVASKISHTAMMPPKLAEICILAGCPKGGTVLDPFGGVGTTGLVADRLQRNAILLELNPEYAAIATERIERERGGLGL